MKATIAGGQSKNNSKSVTKYCGQFPALMTTKSLTKSLRRQAIIAKSHEAMGLGRGTIASERPNSPEPVRRVRNSRLVSGQCEPIQAVTELENAFNEAQENGVSPRERRNWSQTTFISRIFSL